MWGARRGEGASYLGWEASHLIYSVSRTRSRMEADVEMRKAKAVQQRKTFIVLRDGAIA